MDTSAPLSRELLDAKIEDDRRAQQAQAAYDAALVKKLESRLRIWRDDYARDATGCLVTIPVHQILELIGGE